MTESKSWVQATVYRTERKLRQVYTSAKLQYKHKVYSKLEYECNNICLREHQTGNPDSHRITHCRTNAFVVIMAIRIDLVSTKMAAFSACFRMRAVLGSASLGCISVVPLILAMFLPGYVGITNLKIDLEKSATM